MMASQNNSNRLNANAGIAIGPILFIIAILAILAAAIAAGSGSFTTGTTTESNRTKSSALVQIGENIKVGMDRITLEGGIDPVLVDTNVSNTSLNNQLFSPVGGGIAPPSTSMSNIPGTDIWYFVDAPIKGIGTGASNDIFAVLRVAPGVCAEVNNRAVANNNVPAVADLGNFAAGTITGGTSTPTYTNWPSSGPDLVGVPVGCVANNNAGSVGDYFYEVLAVQ